MSEKKGKIARDRFADIYGGVDHWADAAKADLDSLMGEMAAGQREMIESSIRLASGGDFLDSLIKMATVSEEDIRSMCAPAVAYSAWERQLRRAAADEMINSMRLQADEGE